MKKISLTIITIMFVAANMAYGANAHVSGHIRAVYLESRNEGGNFFVIFTDGFPFTNCLNKRVYIRSTEVSDLDTRKECQNLALTAYLTGKNLASS